MAVVGVVVDVVGMFVVASETSWRLVERSVSMACWSVPMSWLCWAVSCDWAVARSVNRNGGGAAEDETLVSDDGEEAGREARWASSALSHCQSTESTQQANRL